MRTTTNLEDDAVATASAYARARGLELEPADSRASGSTDPMNPRFVEAFYRVVSLKGVWLTWIARTAMPLFFVMGAVMLVYLVPGLVLWLPSHMQVRA